MVSTYEIDKEEILRNFIKYSVPLFESKEARKRQGDNHEDISDRVKEELENNVEDKSRPSSPGNKGNSIYNSLVPLYPSYSLVGAYLDRRIEAMHDFSDRVPGKHLHTFPVSGNEGLYGFTFLGDVHAWRREDLIGSKKGKETDIHECIHTPNEYETRILTSWIMSRERAKYIK